MQDCRQDSFDIDELVGIKDDKAQACQCILCAVMFFQEADSQRQLALTGRAAEGV